MLEKFENRYVKEEKEIIVLFKESCNGGVVFEKKWIIPSLNFIAMIDENTGEINKDEGRIEWLIENTPDRKGWGYDFKQYQICKLLVRKCISKELLPGQSAYMNNRYMLVKVLEEDVQNEQLLEYKEYLSRPIYIKTKYGQFELDRSYSCFSAEIELNGFMPTIYLETDEENEETAEVAYQSFLKMADNFVDFDQNIKEYAAQNLLDIANEWLEMDEKEDKPEKITKEMFIKAMEVSEISFYPDGSVSVFYHDGGMFWGHVIEVSIEEDGTISDANIAG